MQNKMVLIDSSLCIKRQLIQRLVKGNFLTHAKGVNLLLNLSAYIIHYLAVQGRRWNYRDIGFPFVNACDGAVNIYHSFFFYPLSSCVCLFAA